MEIDTRKGFVYTLESAIAASLMLGTVIFVIPEIQQTQPPALEDLNSAMRSLHGTDSLGSSVSEIEDSLRPYTPSNYNLTVLLDSVRTRDESVDGSDEFLLEEGDKELMLWIESASNLEITYRGDTVFDLSQPGYHRVSLSSEPGYLNVTGDSQLDLRVNHLNGYGDLPDSSQAYSTNYIDHNGTLREIQVVVWR